MLQALIDCKQYEIIGVVTQPDRPVGRKQILEQSPVKEIALKNKLTIFQPESLKTFDFRLSTFDSSIVCQYGLIIPKTVLALPKKGTINIHTSLLPKYRGASPIQTTLMNGETESGVTLMLMDERMDHGPILAQEKVAISPDDTTETLSKKMAPVAAQLLTKNLPLFLAGKLTPQVQDENLVTTCKILSRDDGKINFSDSAQTIYNKFRGLTPWPGIWTTWDNKRVKLLNIRPSNLSLSPGLVKIDNNKLHIGTTKGSIEIIELQLEGKKPMPAPVFLAGYKTIDGATLQ